MGKPALPETTVARPVVDYLTGLQWDVYQEVMLRSGGNRADIVALLGQRIWVVEVKTSLTFDVIAQARGWLASAHYVSVAVPRAKHSRGRDLAFDLCKDLGIGVIECYVEPMTYGPPLSVAVSPKLGRSRVHSYFADGLRRACVPERKTWGEAGNAQNQYYSAFRGTCDQLRRLIAVRGPLPAKEAATSIHHHYTSDTVARSSLVAWVRAGKVDGVRVDDSVRPMRFVLAA